ncbi:hypothetical protein SO802_027366 [Lithocarpus litseifolius]|uniref:Uncharacterized protein n=1 Tax=Lithocarpus litseifolius TaxID=425828 RepID=A0AAW2C428_9ROSI
MTGFMPKSSFSTFPVLPPPTTFTVTVANPPHYSIMEEQFLLGVKIAAAIISLMILIAVLCKYWSNYSSSTCCQTTSGNSVTNTGGDIVVQVQLPLPNMVDSGLALV